MEFVTAEYRKKVLDELHTIETSQDVKILFAIESGSRAWGFPSPDSDYDARFVYVRRPDWYLSITPGRDVIELPIDDLLDINGWDIKKALGLLLKPNPVLLEWLNSPIRYLWNAPICEDIKSFAQTIAHQKACLYHYRSLGIGQYRDHLENKSEIKLKKLLYVLRPALAVRWTRLNPGRFPPVDFRELMTGCQLDPAIQGEIKDIIALKSKAKEQGLSPARPALSSFCLEELEKAKSVAETFESPAKNKLPQANELFRSIVRSVWG